MATKGGSRRQAVPEVDSDQLRNLFEQHVKENGVKKALFFGSYSNIARTQAVECAGLVENYDILKQVAHWWHANFLVISVCMCVHISCLCIQVLAVAPACEIRNKVLRDVIRKLSSQFVGMNDSGLTDDLFAGTISSTICLHKLLHNCAFLCTYLGNSRSQG
jgi:hypothetical protein